MSKESISELLKSKCEPIINELNYELVDVEFVKEGSDWFLRFYIDKDGGIGLDDCKSASEKINKLIEELDPIKHNYFLEVSSPGVERVLKRDKDLEQSINKLVEIKLYKRIDNKKIYVGNLLSWSKDIVTILEKDVNKEVEINRKDISQIKTIYSFDI